MQRPIRASSLWAGTRTVRVAVQIRLFVPVQRSAREPRGENEDFCEQRQRRKHKSDPDEEELNRDKSINIIASLPQQ